MSKESNLLNLFAWSLFTATLIGPLKLTSFTSIAFAGDAQSTLSDNLRSESEGKNFSLRKMWQTSVDDAAQITSLQLGKGKKLLLVVSSNNSIRLLDADTGLSAWPTESRDDQGNVNLYRGEGQQRPSQPFPASALGPNHWVGLIDGASVGLPFETAAIAMNLLQEGRVEWEKYAFEFAGEAGFELEPTLTVQDGRCWLLLRKKSFRPSADYMLVAVNAEGKVEHRLSIKLTVPILVGNIQLLSDESRILIVSANELLVFEDGLIESPRQLLLSNSERTDQGVRALLAEEVLYVLTSSELLAFNLKMNAEIWRMPVSPRSQNLLGVSEDSVLVSGAELTAFDRKTGQELWQVVQAAPGGQGTGLGVLQNEHVLWPTTAELCVISAATGKVFQRIPASSLSVSTSKISSISRARIVIAGEGTLSAWGISQD